MSKLQANTCPKETRGSQIEACEVLHSHEPIIQRSSNLMMRGHMNGSQWWYISHQVLFCHCSSCKNGCRGSYPHFYLNWHGHGFPHGNWHIGTHLRGRCLGRLWLWRLCVCLWRWCISTTSIGTSHFFQGFVTS